MMDSNLTADFKALVQTPEGVENAALSPAENKKAKAKAKAKLDREIGRRRTFFKASLKLFFHVFVITGALLMTDWIFNNGLQTQLIYRGSGPNKIVGVMKNKAYHVNAYVKSTFSF